MKKVILLAKPDQVLASNRSRSTKLRCSDLWSQKMKKEAVEIMWAKHDPRVQKFHWRTKEVKNWQPPEEGLVSTRISQYIERVKSRERPASVYQPWGMTLPSVCDLHIQNCSRLQSELHSNIHYLKATTPLRRSRPAYIHTHEEAESGLDDFIKDEVSEFKKKTFLNNPELTRKPVYTSLAKRMNKLGLSFYVAQRRRPPA